MRGTAQQAGRNDECPCGSGKKYKRCCAAKAGKASPGQRLLFVAIAAAIAGGLYLTIASRVEPGVGTTGVWSAEHGHYH
jgi:hypothetical protein